MKKIIIGFSKPKGKFCPIFSWGIRLYQGWTPYSHVYLKLHSESLNRDIIYQASGAQVNFVGNTIFKTHVHIVKEFEIEITNKEYIKLLQFAIDHAGKPYSIRDICAILFNKPKWLDGDKGFVCSELIGHILKNYKNLSNDKILGLNTPKDIYELIKTNQNQ